MIKSKLVRACNAICDVYMQSKRILLSKKITISIGDIMHVRQEPTNNQVAVAALLLDIENYCSGDNQLIYQTTMKKLYYGENYITTEDNIKFSNLINSFLLKGYNNSRVFVDNEIRLFNGTHRTALCLFTNTSIIRAYMLPQKEGYIISGIEHLKKINVPVSLRNIITEKLSVIQEELINSGNVFFSYISKSHETISDCFNDIIEIKKKIRIKESSSQIHCLDLAHGGYLYAFVVEEPIYKYKKHRIVSSVIVNLEKQIREQFNIDESNFWISKSCYEGKQMYDVLFPYFIKD